MASVHDWADVESAAKAAAGNHRKFTSFAWYERPEDDDRWTIVYTHNRDSTLLDQSNADAIEKAMEPHLESGDAVGESHNHWAVGWVAGYAIRVYRPDGTITEAFKTWCELQARLEDYLVLDETDYSNREHEATLEHIGLAGRRFLKDGVPDDWESQAFDWFWENNQRAVESTDDQGGYPDDDEMKDCLFELGWLDDDYMPPQGLHCHICGRLVCDWVEGNAKEVPPHYPHLDLNGHATPADPAATDACLGSGLEGVVEYLD